MNYDAARIYVCHDCRSLTRSLSARQHHEVEERYRRVRYRLEALDQLRRRGRADLDRHSRALTRYGAHRGTRILEIGSYTGAFLEYARAAGSQIIGVDINPTLVEFCRQHGDTVECGQFRAHDFEPATFDSVWILNCFEQLLDPRRVLDDIAVVLQPGGTLVIRTPSADFVHASHQLQASTVVCKVAVANGLLDIAFARCFSAPALIELLTEHGFTDVQVTGREFSTIPPLGWPRWWGLLRHARTGAYRVATSVSGKSLFPWLEVVATRGTAAPDDAVAGRR